MLNNQEMLRSSFGLALWIEGPVSSSIHLKSMTDEDHVSCQFVWPQGLTP